MNFSQLHERVRIEILRRIDRGVLTPSMLARQTGFVPAHISNFLNCKRMLSLAALDKVLFSQGLTVADLLDAVAPVSRASRGARYQSVPVVSNSTAIYNSLVPPSMVLDVLKIRSGLLRDLRSKCSARRRAWDRFVGVRIGLQQAESMRPVLPVNATLLIDRHYNSATEYSHRHRTIHAVRYGNLLRFRYVEVVRGQLVLRPHNLAYPIELLELNDSQTVGDLLVGRVFLYIAET
jgi:hypothetical protein